MDLKTKILGANDRPIQSVPVPEWDCTVFLRPMTGLERDKWEAAKVESDAAWAGGLLAATLCDEAGVRVFTAADAAAIGERNGDVLLRLAGDALRINGMGKKAQEAAAGN